MYMYIYICIYIYINVCMHGHMRDTNKCTCVRMFHLQMRHVSLFECGGGRHEPSNITHNVYASSCRSSCAHCV